MNKDKSLKDLKKAYNKILEQSRQHEIRELHYQYERDALKKELKQEKEFSKDSYHKFEDMYHRISKAIEYIKQESWFCYKDNEEVIDRTPVEKLLDILKGEDKYE